ncbi:MAG: SRPBCC family protein [Actinomycetes bacterium]
MKISGTAALAAPPDVVFDALHDPGVLVATIPGVQTLQQVGPDRYRMRLHAGVASINGEYDGEVALTEQQPPSSFTLRANGAGAPGTVDATVHVALAEEGGGTRLSYDAEAVVGGMVGGVGQRMLTGVSKRMAEQFFGNVDAVLSGRRPERGVEQGEPAAATTSAPGLAAQPSAGAAAADAPGQLYRAPAAAGFSPGMEYTRVPFWVVLAGVGAGAFWALAGVLVGWRIARRP